MEDYLLTIDGTVIEDDDDLALPFTHPFEIAHQESEEERQTIEKKKEVKNNEQTEIVKIYVTPAQKEKIKKAAGNMSVSNWARNTLLGEYNGKYEWEIYSGDLDKISEELSKFNNSMRGFINSLDYRSELYKSDIDHIEQLLQQTCDAVVSSRRAIMRDRIDIRKKLYKSLRDELQKVLEAQRIQNDTAFGDDQRGRKGKRKS